MRSHDRYGSSVGYCMKNTTPSRCNVLGCLSLVLFYEYKIGRVAVLKIKGITDRNALLIGREVLILDCQLSHTIQQGKSDGERPLQTCRKPSNLMEHCEKSTKLKKCSYCIHAQSIDALAVRTPHCRTFHSRYLSKRSSNLTDALAWQPDRYDASQYGPVREYD